MEKRAGWTTYCTNDTQLSDAQKFVKRVLNFMASQGSQVFNTMELLGT